MMVCRGRTVPAFEAQEHPCMKPPACHLHALCWSVRPHVAVFQQGPQHTPVRIRARHVGR
jgi:hypothetical protein